MFRIVDQTDRAEVYLYGRIGQNFWGEGNSAKGFIDTLKNLSPKPLDIHIDSGGGDVFEGYAICSAIQRYEGQTTAYVDGLAASAASYIACVCDVVKMNEYAWIMIHNASAYVQGNADELEKIVSRLRGIDESIATIYERRSLLTLEEIKEAMASETWYTANEALEVNLCQEVIETEERMAACLDDESAREYMNVPDSLVSHAPTNLDEASYFAVDGRVYRKEENEL